MLFLLSSYSTIAVSWKYPIKASSLAKSSVKKPFGVESFNPSYIWGDLDDDYCSLMSDNDDLVVDDDSSTSDSGKSKKI